MAVEKRDAGNDDNGERETNDPAGKESLHFSILTQALVFLRRR
jgi:hypothetical protein